jgi:hypothetical protein
MRGREPIVPQRRRRVPPQFSWVDHRLVRDGHVQGRSAPALALYLFLVAVADADGLSWYSEAALCRQLSCGAIELQSARTELQQAGLIAYRKPLYQVLDLAPVPMQPPTYASRLSACGHAQAGTTPRRDAEPVAIGTILQHLLGGAR